MSRVSLRNVTKKCPNNDMVVKNFSLDIEEGEFVVLTGMAGCGKTLVIRMIAGLEECDSGDICIDDEIVNDMETKDRGVAMVFRNYTLYPNMNVYDNMAFALKMERLPANEISRRIRETAEFMEMEPLLERMPSELTEEQTIQAVIGRAVAKEPRVLLMDDTLGRLTGESKKFIEEKMVALNRKMGIPFIYATQGQEEAMDMASRIVIMNEGEIVQAGSPAELYEHPAKTFVALFLGDPHINMVQAEVVSRKNGCELKLGENTISLTKEQKTVLEQSGSMGKNVFLGIRPEDMEIAGKKTGEGKGLIRQAIVESYEEKGGRRYLCASLDEARWTVPAGEKELPKGEAVDLAFSTEKAHIFCAETGELIR